MIRNKLFFERQVDEKLFQALIPHEANWQEAVAFAQDFLNYCVEQNEKVKKAEEEKALQSKDEQVEDAIVEKL